MMSIVNSLSLSNYMLHLSISRLPPLRLLLHLNVPNILRDFLQNIRRPLMILSLRLGQLDQIPEWLRSIQHIAHHTGSLIDLLHEYILSMLQRFVVLFRVSSSAGLHSIELQTSILDSSSCFIGRLDALVESRGPAREEFALDFLVLVETGFADFFGGNGEFLKTLGERVGFGAALGCGCGDGLHIFNIRYMLNIVHDLCIVQAHLTSTQTSSSNRMAERLGLRLRARRSRQSCLSLCGSPGFAQQIDLFRDGFAQILEAFTDVWWVVVGLVGVLRGRCEEFLVRGLEGVN